MNNPVRAFMNKPALSHGFIFRSLIWTFQLALCVIMVRNGSAVLTPSITEFTPSSGPAGTSVTIRGTNLEGATGVQFNGVAAEFNLFTGEGIVATVPPGAGTGPITVSTAAGTAASSSAFTVTQLPPPQVAGFTPVSGPVGTEVNIGGEFLSGTSVVTFNGVPATFREGFAGTNLVAKVPVGATTGPVKVVTPSGSFTTTSNFTVISAAAPTITEISPVSAPAGSTVTINGSNLSFVTQVTFNGVQASFTLFGTVISATVPQGATTGLVTVTGPGGSATSASEFTVTAAGAPVITSITPMKAKTGSIVTITGENLGTVFSVLFNGIEANFQIFGPSLFVTVPSGAASGTITLENAKGKATSSSPFVAIDPLSPEIESFTPESGAPGTAVSITGTNFLGVVQVSFGGIIAPSTALSATQINAVVPAKANTGPITVTTSAGTAVSTNSFFVSPEVESFEPDHGAPGTPVLVHGRNFTGAVIVLFGGVSATFTVESVTQIRAFVPGGTASGSITVATPVGFGTSEDVFYLPPTIAQFDPAGGFPGGNVTISGENLSGASHVDIGGVNTTFQTVSLNTLVAAIPEGVKNGPISVTTPGGTAVSANRFFTGVFSDVAVGLTTSATSVGLGDLLAYTITVTNRGPLQATNVVVTEQLPPQVQLLFAPSGANCVQVGNLVTCDLGTLVSGLNVAIQLSTTVLSGPYITNRVSVTAAGADPDLLNNTGLIVTPLIGAPPLTNDVELAISAAGSSLTLSWPAGFGYQLESTASLVPPVAWAGIANTPVVVSGRETVVVNVAPGTRFYRLRAP